MRVVSQHSLALMLAASFASTIGGLPFNSLPILLGSLADTFGLAPHEIGLLGSICFAGYLLGTLSSVLIISRFCLRKLTVACAVASCLLLLLSAVSEVNWQMPLWALIGFFAALMTCLGLRIIGQMINKERALGVRQGIELGVTAIVLFALPAYVISQFGYAGAAISLSLIILLLSISVFWLPKNTHLAHEDLSIKSQLNIPKSAWMALLVFLVFATGNIALWAFLERIGNSIKLEPAQLGILFAVLKLLGGAAAFSVALVGSKLGLRKPYIIVLSVLAIGLYLIWLSLSSVSHQFVLFAMGAWIWEVAFTWGCVFQTAAVARLDAKGRAIMLIPAAFGVSAMVGPALGGWLASSGYQGILALAFTTSLVSMICFIGPLAVRQRQVLSDPLAS
ncbi:MFS transporter [Colwellia sp. PAMC 21821]|uniref:MFS transporter n=1 Tax=Colwellia sp. PAMC 21821 TaxID=1816219 RepID=UPI0009BF6B21|nr:MFS transporter [Colwellia sp. PAMC 21821]ARD46153.1 arabinose ABC transporter permease [Colwellia sp. PAMC 21821]